MVVMKFLVMMVALHPRTLPRLYRWTRVVMDGWGRCWHDGPWSILLAGHAAVVVTERRVRDREAVMALPLALRGALFFDVALPHALRISCRHC